MLLASTALALWVELRFVLLVVATGLASITVSLTGYCIVGNMLSRLGFTGALSDPATRDTKVCRVQTDAWYLERRIYMAVGINISPWPDEGREPLVAT